MHEYGICEEILEAVLFSAGEHGANEVTSVDLEVGVLRGIVKEHLLFFFRHLSKGTCAEGAALNVKEKTLTVTCHDCGILHSREMIFSCPKCGSWEISVGGGDEIRISSLEIETD